MVDRKRSRGLTEKLPPQQLLERMQADGQKDDTAKRDAYRRQVRHDHPSISETEVRRRAAEKIAAERQEAEEHARSMGKAYGMLK